MTASNRAILLIGLRASGKTSVGRHLASRLGAAFTDLDDLTASEAAMPSAADVLNRMGVARFRALETRALRHALATPNIGVLAMGGGTPTHAASRALIEHARREGRCRVVYLHASPPLLVARLSTTALGQRPSLTGKGVLEEVPALYAARDALYRGMCDAVVDVDAMPGATIERVADAVLAALGVTDDQRTR